MAFHSLEGAGRALVLAAALAAAFSIAARAQTPSEAGVPLAFEVASVKPSAPGARGGIIRPMPGNQTYVAANVPLRLLITVAYGVTDRQISGGPGWVGADLFDVNAKAARPGTINDLHRMLQSLLEDRFQLKVHREIREVPVWALVVEKGGPKMSEHNPQDKDNPPFGPNGRGGMAGRNARMSDFAYLLSRALDRNVIDRTGLTGRYNVDFQWMPERRPQQRPGLVTADSEDSPQEPDTPTIFSALREQLGLKLEAQKGPVEFLVIEHAEKPQAD